VLQDHVTRRAPFDAYDQRAMDAARRHAATPSAATPSMGRASRDPMPSTSGTHGRPATGGDAFPGACRDWNLRECARQNCQLPHRCMWIACRSADRGHRGADCEYNPGSARGGPGPPMRQQPRGGYAHRRGGGSGSGSRGGAPAHPHTPV
jgi:hypothetical protein